jgi:hypothetical protein
MQFRFKNVGRELQKNSILNPLMVFYGLKKLFEDQTTRKIAAVERREHYKTGGGSK